MTSFKKLEETKQIEDDRKVMILYGYSSEELSQIIETVKQSKGFSKTIIAVTTPFSLEMKLKDLIEELKKEDKSVKNRSL